jgi:signal transduction histidine kinase
MKQNLAGLLQRYVSALRKHLNRGSDASLRAALRLGSEAVALGLETQGLARIHERALAILEPSTRKRGMNKRGADTFLARAAMAFEETHRAARGNKIPLSRRNTPGSRDAVEPASANGHLRRAIVRCAVNKNAFQPSGIDENRCLKESLQLQKRLRQLTHQALAAQEDERKKMSCELRDQIAQTLLGINVRLLSLKVKAQSNPEGLKKEIASTRRLVVKSVKFVRQFARELHDRQEGQGN